MEPHAAIFSKTISSSFQVKSPKVYSYSTLQVFRLQILAYTTHLMIKMASVFEKKKKKINDLSR